MTFFYSTDKYNLNELEINILNYLEKNINDIKNISIRKLAKENFTSTATIYKLIKKLGFDGYADMIYALHYDNLNKSLGRKSNSPYEAIENSLNPYKENFLKLLNKYKDKQIVVTGMGFSQIVADYISESLFLKGFNITSKLHIQFLNKDNANKLLLIIISQSSDTPRLVELATKAKENNLEIISFTGSENNKISSLSNLSIKTRTNPKFKVESNFFSGECIIAIELLTQTL